MCDMQWRRLASEFSQKSSIGIPTLRFLPGASRDRWISALFREDWAWISSVHSEAAAAAKSLQSCPTLCHPTDGSPPGSPVPGILQARTLEWVAISFFNVWKWKVKVKSLSRARLLVTPWTAAHQAPPSMGFSRQEYWSGVPSPSLVFTLDLRWGSQRMEVRDVCFTKFFNWFLIHSNLRSTV